MNIEQLKEEFIKGSGYERFFTFQQKEGLTEDEINTLMQRAFNAALEQQGEEVIKILNQFKRSEDKKAKDFPGSSYAQISEERADLMRIVINEIKDSILSLKINS